MRLLITFTLLTICFPAPGQTYPTKNNNEFRVDTLIGNVSDQKSLTSHAYTSDAYRTYGTYGNIHTEIKYTDSTGNSVTIQNSGPRGGRGFTDPTGIKFGYRIFWTRVINDTSTPLELKITFPADSFPLSWGKDSYMKVFLHSDTMEQDGLMLPSDYARKQFEDTTLLKSLCHVTTKLQRTLKPKESCFFYTVVLRHHERPITSPRAGYILKPQGLFYKITEFGSELIPCGQIVFRR